MAGLAEGDSGVEEPQTPLAVCALGEYWSSLPDFSRDVDTLALSQNKQVRSMLHVARQNTVASGCGPHRWSRAPFSRAPLAMHPACLPPMPTSR